jgi:hypothetical protein
MVALGQLCACSVDARVFQLPGMDASIADVGARSSNNPPALPRVAELPDTAIASGTPDAGMAIAPTSANMAAAVTGGRDADQCANMSDAGMEMRGLRDWLINALPCESDADCVKTLFTPICDTRIARCSPCQEVAQQFMVSAIVGICIARSVQNCCRQDRADLDCLFQDCVTACEAQ